MIIAVTPSTLHQWLTAGEAIVIDVREPGEFASGHIPGAVSQPLSRVCCAGLPTDKKIVMQCQGGRRSEAACQTILREAPDREIYNLTGGLGAWVAAGLPLAGGTRSVLPLDRQVQLTVGTILLLGSALGYSMALPVFFLLTGAIGLGLGIAGATGFCGLARLLAIMPWNRA